MLGHRSELPIIPAAWALDSSSLTSTFKNQQFLVLPSDGLSGIWPLLTTPTTLSDSSPSRSPLTCKRHKEAYFKSQPPFGSSLFCSIFFPWPFLLLIHNLMHLLFASLFHLLEYKLPGAGTLGWLLSCSGPSTWNSTWPSVTTC